MIKKTFFWPREIKSFQTAFKRKSHFLKQFLKKHKIIFRIVAGITIKNLFLFKVKYNEEKEEQEEKEEKK